MELEDESQRRRYQICRFGFGLISFGLVIASLATVLALTRLFIGPGYFDWVFQTPFWKWRDIPIVWGTLIGTYLLWGRWAEPSWQRRAGLLVLMGVVDAVLWLLEHGDALGLRVGEVGHEWLRGSLGEALGWSEFALLASLAADLMAHLGVEHAPEAGRATRSLAATGAIVWLLSFLERTSWRLGWPLQERPGFVSLESLLLFFGTQMLWTITLIQVTALTIAATRQATQVLDEIATGDREHDLLLLPSALDHEQLLLAHDDPKHKCYHSK